VVAGAAAPPLEPCLRALWPELVAGDQLESAYAVDAGAQELIFIAGPLAVAGVAALGPAPLALWLAAGLGLLGSLVMATARPSREWRAETRDAHWLGPLRSPALLLLLVALFGAGWAVGGFQRLQRRLRRAALRTGRRGPAHGAVGVRCAARSRELRRAALDRRRPAQGRTAVCRNGRHVLAGGARARARGACLVAAGTGVFFAPLLTVSFGLVGELAPTAR